MPVLQFVEVKESSVLTDRMSLIKKTDMKNNRPVSGYECDCGMCVLYVGQGFVVRKDMDHFSQLIHSMYTVHPHQSI